MKNEDSFIQYIKKDYPLAFIQSTDWISTGGAFEKNLTDKGIKWMFYIKFYINKNVKSLPIVVGKTGSLLVNFSENVVDGSSHIFLNDNNF